MGFLLCGRFRKIRRFTPPSECSPSDQFTPAEPLPLRHSYQKGSSATEDSQPPVQNERHSSHSSSGWSGRLRRRLSSRDSRPLRLLPKRADRSTEISLLSLSRNLDALADLVAAEDVGSSLVSEKGYDSDAQCISTPAQAALTKRPHTAASLERAMSSLEKPYQEAGMGYTTGQPQELRPEDENRTNEQHEISNLGSDMARPAYVRHSPPGTVRGAARRVSSPLANVTNLSIHDRDVDTSRPVSISERSVNSAETGHGVSTPPSSINGGHGRFYATVAQQGLQAAQASYAKSSDSLIVKRSEIAVAKKHQHRESSAEIRSIHLGDMNISKALASTSTSPRILSQNSSVDDNGQTSGYSIRSLSDQYHDCIGQRSANTPSLGQNGLNGFDFGLPHKRDASSFYSPKSSISSARTSAGYRFPSPAANASGLLGFERGPSGTGYEHAPAAQPYADMSVVDPSTAASESGAQDDALTSKFVEEFGISPPVGSPRSNEALPPRKISVGWMSGGRRIGYGYSLVSEDEDESQKPPIDSKPPEDNENNGAPDEETDGENAENQDHDSDGQSARQANRVSSALDEPSNLKNDLPASMNHQTFRRWSGATALVRASESSDRTFWEWLTSRRIGQNDPGEKAGERGHGSGCTGSDEGQSPDLEGCPKSSFMFRNRYSELFDRSKRMRFPLDRRTNRCSATEDGSESVVQTPSDTSQFGSLPKKRPRVKFRVLNRSKRRNTNSSADFPSVSPVKRSLSMHNSESSGVHGRSVDPGPGRYRPKRLNRFGPDAEEDRDSLEMHSDPE